MCLTQKIARIQPGDVACVFKKTVICYNEFTEEEPLRH